ncbi:hypothetical protein NQ315_005564 [Exocentrus adspersus]|uniref:Vacuolar protein sorting-associated protein VTA1-like protein n=1 Tax=Exocentrus adspersus TaxID=1586481 RepID=A0AAV8VTR3_9CUCU|nr:hypothetical protein NQ315_005564 [Exocentrus adspersus]
MVVPLPPIPKEVKPVAHLLKLADEHDERNIVVAYWARMSACLLALRIVPGKKSPETAELIRALLDWLEQMKKEHQDNDGIVNETTGQALIEEYALRLFEHADEQDKAGIFNKNTVKTFYTTGILMDVLDQFGPLADDIREKRKYAKWKAAYIHNCLKAGEVPLPGPPKPANDPGNIVHNSEISEDELSTYTKYTGPIPLTPEEISKLFADKPQSPTSPLAGNFGFNLPKPEDDFTHAPASSPITPVVPQQPASPSTPIIPPEPATVLLPAPSSGQVSITPEQIQKAQKFCKFATSALNYDDVKSAIENLHKALNLLQLGREE